MSKLTSVKAFSELSRSEQANYKFVEGTYGDDLKLRDDGSKGYQKNVRKIRIETPTHLLENMLPLRYETA